MTRRITTILALVAMLLPGAALARSNPPIQDAKAAWTTPWARELLALKYLDYITQSADDHICLYGAGGADDTDACFDVDGTYPVWWSSTDTKVGIDDDLEFVGAQTVSTSAGNLTLAPAGSLLITSALTLSGAFAFTGTTWDLDPTGAYTLDMDAAQAVTVTLADMDAAYVLQAAGGEDMLLINYSAGTKSLILGNAADNPPITQLGTGQVTWVGNVDATAGLDVSVAGFTMTGTTHDLDPTGNYTLDLDAAAVAAITVGNNEAAGVFVLQDAEGDDYISLTTTAAAEALTLGNATENPVITQLGTGQVTFAGNVDAGVGLDVTGGNFTAAGGTVDLDPTGNYTLNLDDATTAVITVDDDEALGVWQVQEGANDYLSITTTNAAEAVTVGNAANNPALTQLGTGQVSFAGNVDAANGLDVSVAGFTFTGTTHDLDPTGNWSLDLDAAATAIITVANAEAAGVFTLQDGEGDDYITITTTGAAEALTLGNATENPVITQLGTGQVTFAGNVDATVGADVTGGNFTAAGGTVDLDPTGAYTLDLDDATTAIVTVDDDEALGVWQVQEGANDYISITTTNAAEAITLGNATTNPAITQLGTGVVTVAGTLDANGQVDLGDGGDTAVISTSDWGVSTDGVATGIDSIATDAGEDIEIIMGDAAGAQAVLFQSVTPATVASINSAGGISAPGLDALAAGALGLGGATATSMDYGSAGATTVHTFYATATGDATVVMPVGAIGAADILDLTRYVNLPLGSFAEGTTPAMVNFTASAGTAPDFIIQDSVIVMELDDDSDGGGADTPDNDQWTTTLAVPATYVSGAAFVFRISKDGETGPASEALICDISVNGAALTGSTDSDAISGAAIQTITSSNAAWSAGVSAGDSVGLNCYQSNASANDIVYIHSAAFSYTATQ